MPIKTASARYDGLGHESHGYVSSASGVLADNAYGLGTRMGEEPGTSPEELLAAAHASCFTMALSFALARAGYKSGTLETEAAVSLDKDGEGFSITRSALTLRATVEEIEREAFGTIADEAKRKCPMSRVLNCEITLDWTLN